jgi:hypothetical protein
MTATTFRPGETLVVQPADGDDPLAKAYAGQQCIFVGVSHSGHAIVKIGNKERSYFRLDDLKREVPHET